MSAQARVFVVRFGALGDVVLITPLLRALHRRHPELALTVVTKHRYASLVETHPAVSDVVALEPEEHLLHFSKRVRIARNDVVLDLHDGLRSRGLRFLTRGQWDVYDKNRRATRQRLRGRTAPPPVPVAERYFTAARSMGVEPDGAPAELFTTQADERQALERVRPGSVVLAPGASRFTKRWPADRWRELAVALHRRGSRLTGLGTVGEREILQGAPIADAFGLPIRVAVAICRQASVVVANDSGLMHVAAAVGTRVVAIFGPAVPDLGFAPYRANATVIERPLPCRPCSVYGTERCPEGHHRCMLEIEPAVVAGAVESAA